MGAVGYPVVKTGKSRRLLHYYPLACAKCGRGGAKGSVRIADPDRLRRRNLQSSMISERTTACREPSSALTLAREHDLYSDDVAALRRDRHSLFASGRFES